jgi:hypothetical protein
VITEYCVALPEEVVGSPISVRRGVVAAALIVMTTLGAAAPAFADPSPPTNGGNGSSSDQCTGSAHDRPGNACQSGNK